MSSLKIIINDHLLVNCLRIKVSTSCLIKCRRVVSHPVDELPQRQRSTQSMQKKGNEAPGREAGIPRQRLLNIINQMSKSVDEKLSQPSGSLSVLMNTLIINGI